MGGLGPGGSAAGLDVQGHVGMSSEEGSNDE